MRITLVIASLGSGGAERVMSGMANYWVAHEQEVTLITIWPAAIDCYRLDPRVKRVALNKSLILPSAHIGEALRSNLQRILRLRHELKRSRPNIVVSFLDTVNVLTLMASWGLGIPVIVSERTDPRHHSIGLIWSGLRSLFYRHADVVVVQSNAVRHWASRLLGRTAIHVIPNPVDPKFNGSEYISNRQSPGHTVVAMGRLGREKGFDLLIQAFARCAAKHVDWSLVIVGEGRERATLEALVATTGIADRVSLPGSVRDPFPILRGADLFVLSSRYEGFPNVLLEAMACGCAVISTDCPSGPREIVHDSVDGVLVPTDNVLALATAMDRLMSDGAERQRLGALAVKVIEKFGVEKVMTIWDELLTCTCRRVTE